MDKGRPSDSNVHVVSWGGYLARGINRNDMDVHDAVSVIVANDIPSYHDIESSSDRNQGMTNVAGEYSEHTVRTPEQDVNASYNRLIQKLEIALSSLGMTPFSSRMAIQFIKVNPSC